MVGMVNLTNLFVSYKMIVMLVNVEKISVKNGENIFYEPCYFHILVRQKILYDQFLLISLFEEKARSFFESVKRFEFDTVRNNLFSLAHIPHFDMRFTINPVVDN